MTVMQCSAFLSELPGIIHLNENTLSYQYFYHPENHGKQEKTHDFLKDVFRTQLHIYDVAFFEKTVNG